MDKAMNFICWLWTPLDGVKSTKKPYKYTYEDVNNLYIMLKRFYKKSFILSCVTDNPKGIDTDIKIIPMWNELRSKGHCFSRLVAFKRGMGKKLGERFVSIDIDCVILDDITDLFDRQEDFVIWSSGNPKNPYCGSLWMLKAGTRTKVYNTFKPDKWIPNGKGRFPMGSDQAQIAKAIPNEATWTEEDGIYNFRYYRNTTIPKNARIVFFNGNFHPRQGYLQKNHPWIKEYYPGNIESSDSLNICTAYWQGDIKSGWNNTDLGATYINKLYKSIKRHLSIPFNFYCFYQHDLDMSKINKCIEKIPFDCVTWKGRLPKLKVFDKDNGFDGRVIMLDLDLLFTANVDDIFSYSGNFMTRGSFKNNCRSGGDLVFFNPKNYYHFWEYVEKEHPIIKECNGNERILYRKYFDINKQEHIDYIQLLYPDTLFSYKKHVGPKGIIPEGCKILSCHGKPRMHRISNREIRKRWR